MFSCQTAQNCLELKSAITRNPLVVSMDITVTEAIIQMSCMGSSCALVVQESELLGILTEGDVIRLCNQQQPLDCLVINQVMTHPVVTLQEASLSNLWDVSHLLRQHRIHHLPILDAQNQLVGLLDKNILNKLLEQQIDSLNLGETEEITINSEINRHQDTPQQLVDPTLSEKQHIEIRPQVNENRYASLTDAVPVGIFQTDALGNGTYHNDRWYQIVGITPEHALGKGWQKRLHPDDLDRVVTEWQQSTQEQRSFQLEYRFSHPNGKVTWVYGQAVAERDKHGQVIGYAGTLTDISDRKYAEIQLEAQNNLLAKIAKDEPLTQILDSLIHSVAQNLNGAPCSILLLDKNNQLHHAAAVGLSPDYVQSMSGLKIGEGQGSCGTAAFRKETVIVTNIAIDPLCKEHKEKLLQHGLQACWSKPILASNGQVLGTIEVYYSDMRSPLTYELAIVSQNANIAGIAIEREHAATTLRESQIRWQFALEGTGDGVWDWHIQNNQVFFSPQWKAMLGYCDHEIGNYVEEWKSRIHPNDEAQCYDNLNKYFKGEILTYQVEHRVLCRDGTYKWILARGKVIEWTTEGQPLRMIGTHTDINDRKQAERQLHNLIEGTATTTGEDFFPALVRHMSEVVNVSYALVTKLVDDKLHVLAFWADGTFKPTFSYLPAKTPCEQALQNGKFYCESLVQEKFPSDLDLVEMEAESYLGIALQDANGKAIGNLCILDKQPIQKIHQAEKLLRVFAARAATELERQQAIQKLEQLNKELEHKVEVRTAALQRSEERWQLSLKGANDGIWDWDLIHNKIFFSERWKEMRGFSKDEISDTPHEYLSRIHPNDYTHVITAVNEHFAGRIEFFEAEYRVRHKNGSYMWVLDRAQAQRDNSGQIIRMIGTNSNISKRKQAETQILEQKQFLRSINDGVDCPIFVIDVLDQNTFAYIYWNAAAEKAIGIPVNEIVGKSPEDIYGTPAGNLERKRLQQCLSTGISVSYEELLRLPENRESWWLTTLNPQKDHSGKIYRIVGTTFNISDRKQAEFDLAVSRQKYYSLIQSVNGIVWEYDLHTNQFTFVSNKAEELLGYPIENWLTEQHFWRNHIYAEDVTEAEKTFNKASQDQRNHELEYRMVASDGSLVWVYDISSFSYNNDGYPTTASGVLIDIRDRKLLEEEQSRLLATLEASTDYISVKDKEYKIIWKNSALKSLQQCNLEQETSKYIVDDHPTWVVNLLQQQALPSAIENGSWVGETVLLDAAGQEVPVSHLILAHKSPQGEVQFFSSIMRDIRDRKEYEQRLECTNAELMRATRLKDEFLTNMSHELRTPLNAILGMTEVLQEEIFGIMNEQQLKALKTIERSGSHLLELINDILDLAKIEAGQIKLHYTATSIHKLCQSSLAFVKQQAFSKKIKLDTKFQLNLREIFIDERRIRQVLINLLSNAVKFTPEGGSITLEVNQYSAFVDATNPQTQYFLQIAVTDTGIGISSENINKLFQPFVQVDSSLNRQYTGTGLGLALVKQITELHGGEVKLTSKLGAGSCFIINLPYNADNLFMLSKVIPETMALNQETNCVNIDDILPF